MPIAVNGFKADLSIPANYNRNILTDQFSNAVSKNTSRFLQRPNLIAINDMCSEANVNATIEKANALANILDGLNQQRLSRLYQANRFEKGSLKSNELHKQADEFYTHMRDKQNRENAARQYMELNTILLSCHRLSSADKKRLQEAQGKLDDAMKIRLNNQKIKIQSQFKSKAPSFQQQTLTPQSPRFEIPEWIPFMFRLLTGSEQKA